MNKSFSSRDSAADTKQEPARTGKGVSRRTLIQSTAAAVATVLPLAAQAPPAAQTSPAAQSGGPARGGGRGMPQGGRGPVNVLLITRDHPFAREPFFQMFDSFGDDITWTHVTQPAAEVFFDPKTSARFDVFVLYDRAGRERRTQAEGRVQDPGDRGARDVNFREPSPQLKKGMKAMLEQGKGMVLFHHALASWVHTWPEYVEMMGGAADWDYPMKIRGKDYPFSGFRGGVQQHVTVVDKTHPIVQGLGDGFDIVDETYLCPIFEESVHPILRTDFKPLDSNFPAQSALGWHHEPGSNLTGWVKVVERSPLVYVQHGHDDGAWSNPAFRTLMLNAIKWVNSREAKAWAAANPKKIFA